MRVVSKPLPKCRLCFSAGTHLSSMAPVGFCLLLRGDVREAFQSIPVLSTCPQPAPRGGDLTAPARCLYKPKGACPVSKQAGLSFSLLLLQEPKISFLPFPPGRK